MATTMVTAGSVNGCRLPPDLHKVPLSSQNVILRKKQKTCFNNDEQKIWYVVYEFLMIRPSAYHHCYY